MNTTGSLIGDGLVLMGFLTAFAVSLWVCEMLAVFGERIYTWFLARINGSRLGNVKESRNE